MNKKRTITFLILFLVAFLSSNAQLSMRKTAEGILVTESNQAVLQYNTVEKNLNGTYSRCNYIHPLFSLRGKTLTEDFPSDHPHQRGIFWAWHQVWINNQRIGDTWEIKNFKQSVEEVEFFKQNDGSVVLNTEVDWLSDKWKKDGKMVPYLKEHSSIRVWPQTGKYRKIDFEIRLLALEEGLRLGGSEDEKGYGGFSVRMILPEDVSFSGPNGVIVPAETAVQSPGFVNISGSIEAGKKAGGIVIIDHPDNPGYPQPWILRVKNSMQNAAWPGREPVSISNTEPIVLKYSLIIYSGKLSMNKIEKLIEP